MVLVENAHKMSWKVTENHFQCSVCTLKTVTSNITYIYIYTNLKIHTTGIQVSSVHLSILHLSTTGGVYLRPDAKWSLEQMITQLK